MKDARGGKYAGTVKERHYEITFRNSTSITVKGKNIQEIRNQYRKNKNVVKIRRDWKRDNKDAK